MNFCWPRDNAVAKHTKRVGKRPKFLGDASFFTYYTTPKKKKQIQLKKYGFRAIECSKKKHRSILLFY